MKENLLYNIAITQIPGIGDILAKNLIAYCGGSEAVFKEKASALIKIPGIGKVLANKIIKQNALERAEEEIKFIEEYNISALNYLDTEYPKRLTHCADSPVMLYYKGNADLNALKILSVVGTRNISSYGKSICEKLVKDLAAHDVLVVSGLAHGVDIYAHKLAVDNNIPTVGVLAHGLDRIYPSVNTATAKRMVKNGGLLTDFLSGTNPDRENFPKRNRIVAGMADATIVVESKEEGGSLITADIANSYSRDVFAFPGRTDDACSRGCNNLIQQSKAALVQSASDILRMMGWEEKNETKKAVQPQLFFNLNPDEEVLVNILKEKKSVGIDDMCFAAKFSMSKVSSLLLSLEFSGVVQSLPGKMYSLA